MKVLIVYKKSSYESHVIDERDSNYLRLLREHSAAIRKSKNTHDIHMETLETIKSHLRDLKIPFHVRLRYALEHTDGYDLVVTIGGDGTFLDTSHYLHAKSVILGINSVPKESVGYYCRATADTFLEKMYDFARGKAKIRNLYRLRVIIDGKKQEPLALNDILFANQNPAGTTRYVLKVRNFSEEQKSSGLWISPAPGSTAATKSAGGRVLPISSKKFQYVVREPYAPPSRRYRLLKGVLKPHEKLEILSVMDEASLYLDGPHCHLPVQRGSSIIIKNADDPIRAIW